jgi:hypothetical protein
MVMVAPCKDFEKRHAGCHDTCEAYLKYRAERDAIQKERLKQKIETPPPHDRRLM